MEYEEKEYVMSVALEWAKEDGLSIPKTRKTVNLLYKVFFGKKSHLELWEAGMAEWLITDETDPLGAVDTLMSHGGHICYGKSEVIW